MSAGIMTTLSETFNMVGFCNSVKFDGFPLTIPSKDVEEDAASDIFRFFLTRVFSK